MVPMYVPPTNTFISQCNACGACGVCGVCFTCVFCNVCGVSPGVAVNAALLSGAGGLLYAAMLIHLKPIRS
jgi:hypothetical protein